MFLRAPLPYPSSLERHCYLFLCSSSQALTIGAKQGGDNNDARWVGLWGLVEVQLPIFS